MGFPARRRTYHWPGVVRELVRAYLRSSDSGMPSEDRGSDLGALVTRISAVSGNPRRACLRLARSLGVESKRAYRKWTVAEQQRLLDLMNSHALQEVTVLLRRSPTSVRAMLHRLGASARMGQDWFTKHALAQALRVRADEVQKWIDRGWLKTRTLGTNGLKREVIDAEDFCQFCKQYRREIVGRRLNVDRLNFVQTFVFPPSHAELLPVRGAKKEQAAYEAQMNNERSETEGEDGDDMRAIA